MRKQSVVVLIMLFFFAVASWAQPDKTVTVRMGVASKDSAFVAGFIAQEAGIAKKYGLHIEFVVIAPPTIPAALMAGDLHFAGPAQTVSRSGVQGLPVATVAIMMDRPNYALLVDKSIRTVDELRGKTIVTKPEASQAFFAKLFALTAAESRQLWELLASAVVADGLIGDDLLKIQVTQDAKILKRPDLTLAQVRAAYDFRITEKVAREMGLLRR